MVVPPPPPVPAFWNACEKFGRYIAVGAAAAAATAAATEAGGADPFNKFGLKFSEQQQKDFFFKFNMVGVGEGV